jgi:hypothetical protein
MNKKQPSESVFVLATLATILFAATILATHPQANAAKNIWEGDGTMKELVKDIDKGKVDDDNMNWKSFKNSKIFTQEDVETQQCIKNRQELSNNLADYEVLRCFKDSGYAYDK